MCAALYLCICILCTVKNCVFVRHRTLDLLCPFLPPITTILFPMHLFSSGLFIYFVDIVCFLCSIYEWSYIFVFLNLTYFHLVWCPQVLSILLQLAGFHLFYSRVVFHIYMSISHLFFIPSSSAGHFLFPYLAIVRNALTNVPMHLSFWVTVFFFFVYIA